MAEETKKQSKIKLTLIILGLLALVILAAVGIVAGKYGSAYREAEELAENWKFRDARDAIFLYPLAEKLDPYLIDYLDAGVFLEDGDYDRARELLTPLAEQDYRDASDLMLETDYRQSKEFLEEENYEAARALLEPMVPTGYRDCDVLLCEAELGCAMAYIQATGDLGKVRNGMDILDELVSRGYEPAGKARNEAYEIIYTYAVELYNRRDYYTAQLYFPLVRGYGRTDDYETLIRAWLPEEEVPLEDIIPLLDLGDCYTLLWERYIYEYLEGEWYTADGQYYFIMEPEHYAWYNMPWYEGDYYSLEDGIMWQCYNDGRESVKQYMILVIEWDVIAVYCYRDDQTYTLYRQ